MSNKTFHEAACDLHDALWELLEASGLLGLCERVLDWMTNNKGGFPRP